MTNSIHTQLSARGTALLAGSVFLVHLGVFYLVFAAPSMPFVLLCAGLVPFLFGLVGVRWYVAWPPVLLAFAVSAVMYMVAEMSGQDPRWWGMMIAVTGPMFFWIGLLPVLLFLLGREARRGVAWGLEQWRGRGQVIERN